MRERVDSRSGDGWFYYNYRGGELGGSPENVGPVRASREGRYQGVVGGRGGAAVGTAQQQPGALAFLMVVEEGRNESAPGLFGTGADSGS